MPQSAIGIGSNLGNPASNVRRAIRALRAAGEVTAVSRLYHAEPWGVEDQPSFVNAVVLVRTQLDPRGLLTTLQGIERQMGRTPTYKWGPRIIDLDILYYDDAVLDEPDLRIPHPHLGERSFVLVPLADVDERYKEAAAALPDLQKIRVLA